MKVSELKRILENADQDNEVVIEVETPSGFVCPDGAVVGIKYVAARGIDWHGHETVITPEYKLKIKNIDNWRSRKQDYADCDDG